MDFEFGSKRPPPIARHSAGAPVAASPPIQRIPATCGRQPISLRLKNHPAPTQLHLSKYSREQIYGFFDLKPPSVTIADLKAAKRQVLMTHPDKSGLSPEYFQFYTKALQVLVDEFAEQNRESHYEQRMKSMQESEFQYDASETAEDLELKRQYQKQASGKEFMTQFNRVFDTEMKRPVVDRNAWFRNQHAEDYADEQFKARSQTDMERALQAIKQHQQAMVVHRGIQELQTSYGGASFYDEDEYDHTEDGSTSTGGRNHASSSSSSPYISTDPFAKLKFDDLRRVHKDETVLSVSERDVKDRTQFRSVDEYNRARNRVSLEPVLSEQEHQFQLQQREAARVERIRQLQRQDELRSAEYARKQEEAKRMILRLK